MKVGKYFITDFSDSPHNAKQTEGTLVWIVSDNSSTLEPYSAFIDKIFAKTPWKDSTKVFLSAAPLNFNRNDTKPKLVLLFGLRPKDCQLQCSYTPYRPLYLSGHVLLFTHSITDIHDSVEHKKKLWAALQEIMNRENV